VAGKTIGFQVMVLNLNRPARLSALRVRETIGSLSPGRGHITRASGWVSIQPLRNLILIELLIAPLKKCPGITDSTCLVIVAIYANCSIERKLVQSFWSETKDWLDENSDHRGKF
jgi:hypothetical protein